MARKEEIEILISEEGLIKFHLSGIKGAKCVDMIKEIAKPLGEIKDMSFTSEYYEKEKIEQKAKQKLK